MGEDFSKKLDHSCHDNCKAATMTLYLILMLIFVLTTLWCYCYRFKKYVHNLGIPIDQRIHWRMDQVNFRKLMEDQQKEFGKVFIEYNSTIPTVVIGDPKLIKEVMVKHFDSFSNRQDFVIEHQHMSVIDAR